MGVYGLKEEKLMGVFIEIIKECGMEFIVILLGKLLGRVE